MSVDYGALAGIAALSSGLNFASGITASNVSSKKARKLAAYQAQLNYHYNKQWAENSPSFTRAGLENAGYNPMLAVQNGVSGANSSFASPNTANDVDLGLGSGFGNAMDLQRVANETNVSESTQDVNYANADKTKAEKASIIQKLPWISKQAKADYMKTEMESAKLENDIHYQNEYLNYLDNSLKLQQRLGEMGINVQMRGQDKAYNASTYTADKNYKGVKYTIDKTTPPKWVGAVGAGVGSAVGAGLGVYGAIRGASKGPKNKNYKGFGGYSPYY